MPILPLNTIQINIFVNLKYGKSTLREIYNYDVEELKMFGSTKYAINFFMVGWFVKIKHELKQIDTYSN